MLKVGIEAAIALRSQPQSHFLINQSHFDQNAERSEVLPGEIYAIFLSHFMHQIYMILS